MAIRGIRDSIPGNSFIGRLGSGSGAPGIISLSDLASAIFAVQQPSAVLGLKVVPGKVLTVDNSLTLAGTDNTTMTFPTTSASIARTDAAQTFTGTQTFGSTIAGSINGNAATVTGLSVVSGKTLTASNSLTLAGVDGSTLSIGAGGTLGSAAFTASSAYAPAFTSASGNQVWATPNGSSGVPSLRALASADIPSIIGQVLTGYVSGAGTVSASDSILSAIQKLNGNIGLLTGAIIYQGTWNASTNIPALASGVGTKGYMYKVSVAGATTIDGISQWNVGDSIVFDGTTWDKIDGIATEVTSVVGRVGAVTLAQADISGLTTGSSPTFAGLTITGLSGVLKASSGTLAAATAGADYLSPSATQTLGAGSTWNGVVISATYGGTGVNNGPKTITLGASLTTTGAGAPTLAFPASSYTYTFPAASITVARSDAAQTLTGIQTLAGGAMTATGNTGSIGSGVATNLYTPQNGWSGCYYVGAKLNAGAGNPNAYTAFATVYFDGSASKITATNGTLLSLSLSGNTVQVTQSSGATQGTGVTWSYFYMPT